MKETARNDMLHILTLYYNTGFTIAQIIFQLNKTKRQVEYALQYSRPKSFLNTPRRKFLTG